MKLRYSAASPYVRKVMVVAHETGLVGKIETIPTNVWAPDTDIAKDNPLGKVPTLVADDGTVLFDSPVICEYLDALAGGKLFPASGKARWEALRLQALGDGVLDAGILRRLESMRPAELQSKDWMARQATVMKRGLDLAESMAASWTGSFGIGPIAIGCAVGWFDFRFGHEDWRPGRPKLAAWYADFVKRPSMQATMPKA
ncbi:MAG TPA: glutathione S-transferase N-terminal domain-containing protein [Alphaproteobacteria bacterium]|nr:glutathione S-transferase N-terminal domain-containing protein [Alphaproteobacteria bacterium]